MTGTFALYWRGGWSFFCVIICIISLGGTTLRRKQNLFLSQNSIHGTKKEPARTLACLWSGWRESNPPVQLGKLAFYRWTTPAYSCIDNTILSLNFPVFLITSSKENVSHDLPSFHLIFWKQGVIRCENSFTPYFFGKATPYLIVGHSSAFTEKVRSEE